MINNIIQLKLESFLKEKHGISSTDPSTGIVLSVALFSLSILVFMLRKEPDLIASKDLTNNPSDSTTSKTSPLIQKRLSSYPPPPQTKEILVANNPVISIQDVTSQQSRMSPTTVTLPKRTWDLYDPLFLLSRQIESQYHSLPWPPQIQNMTIFTRVAGGRGDIATAAHVIDLLQNIQPTLKFNWLLHGAVSIQDMDAVQKKIMMPGVHLAKYNPISFLNTNPLKVRVHYICDINQFNPSEQIDGDFLVVGPVDPTFTYEGTRYEKIFSQKTKGPTFGFIEIAGGKNNKIYSPSCEALNNIKDLHSTLFPNSAIFPIQSENSFNNPSYFTPILPMGLKPGTGVFIDQSRVKAPLSRRYCCPSYLLNIQNQTLRKDILESMNIFDEKTQPDYNQYSFNFGYAHCVANWGKFIDCVAIHESDKHVVIVLNQHGRNYGFDSHEEFSEQTFIDKIFTQNRLSLLKEQGYVTVIFKGETIKSPLLSQTEKEGRHLTVIVRPSFTPSDMKHLQLASERILATGDNSAVEAWSAKCKLYLYEDIKNMGCKTHFLAQQIDLAKRFSPTLSRILTIFGEDIRSPLPENRFNSNLSQELIEELKILLKDPTLGDKTLEFCEHITSNYSFNDVLEGALKRTAWHHVIPELGEIEANALSDFYREFGCFLQNPEEEKVINVTTIPEMKIKIYEAVRQHLEKK